MNDGNMRYDRVISETARQWFGHCGNLLVWDWDHEVSGPCHPSVVARCHEDRTLFPAAVKKHSDGVLLAILREEWKRAGLTESKMPVPQPVPDHTGRMAWFLDLRKTTQKVRSVVGQACMREVQFPAWDFQSQGLAFAGASKTSVIHVGDDRHVCEPTMADLVEVLEAMKPEDSETGSFTLVHPGRSYLSMLMTLEGCIVQIRTWIDRLGMNFRHLQAGLVENALPCRIVGGGIPTAEENYLPWDIGMALALAYHANPNHLPQRDGIFWQDVSGEFSD